MRIKYITCQVKCSVHGLREEYKGYLVFLSFFVVILFTIIVVGLLITNKPQYNGKDSMIEIPETQPAVTATNQSNTQPSPETEANVQTHKPTSVKENTIYFSGIEWKIKYSDKPLGAGPNIFNASNVWVDDKGRLHLAITCEKDSCSCAEVFSVEEYKFGVFEFKVEGSVAYIDSKAVLGLFLYYSNYHEIDVEISRWGQSGAPNAQFVVQPYTRHPPHRFYISPQHGEDMIYVVEWEPKKITFKAYIETADGERILVDEWSTRVREVKPMRIHIDLWLIDQDGDGLGDLPIGDGGLEVVILGVSVSKG